MNYLRRRFSSSDIQKDLEDEEIGTTQSATAAFFGVGGNKKAAPSPSAPSSPSKPTLGNITSNIASNVTGSVGGLTRGILSTVSKPAYNKDKCKTLLVIDDQHTDWSRYFKGRKVFGDYDIRLEQAEFKEITLASYSDSGVIVDVQCVRSGTRINRSFKPDFVLVRQPPSDAAENWKNIIIGLHYGGVPSVNSLEAIYNMLDKAWVFSQLTRIQKKLGKELFPLIDQTYFPNHKQMAAMTKFPVVVKIGNANQGLGKVKADNAYDFHDLASVIAVTDCYATTEPFYESKYDIHIQKIGTNYKAYMRKSISGNWKANTGSAMLEQITVNESFKLWVDEVSELFGGLDICAVQAVQAKDGRQYIIEAKGSSMTLLGESQEDDRKLIADLVLQRMQTMCKLSQQGLSQGARPAVGGGAATPMGGLLGAPPTPMPRADGSGASTPGSMTTGMPPIPQPRVPGTPAPPLRVNRSPAPSARPTDNGSIPQNLSMADRTEAVIRDLQEEDTMSNLKKTFAGIFGDL